MTPLTKVFIVLHVVLTMLFVAGTIVLVNRVEEFQATGKQNKAQLDVANRRATDAEAALQAQIADRAADKQQMAGALALVRDQLTAAQKDIRQRDTQLALSQGQVDTGNARLQATTSALQTAQKTVAMLQEQITQLREASDKLQRENSDNITQVADLTSRLQVAQRQLRQANEELDQLRDQLADNGGNQPAATTDQGPTGSDIPTPTASVPINGIVSDVKPINGVPIAIINVGSADNVAKGTVFNVIDREGGDWLGTLTVEQVEAHEATGKLDGPRVADIRKGNEVRTQL